MAQRKKPQTDPVKDSKSAADGVVQSLVLPPDQFNSVIRGLKTGTLDRAGVLKQAAEDRLKELGLKPGGGKVVKGVPEGSDQGDAMTIITWMKKVGKGNKSAIAQIKSIYATAAGRSA